MSLREVSASLQIILIYFFFRNKFALLIGTVDKQIRKKGENYEDISYRVIYSFGDNGER